MKVYKFGGASTKDAWGIRNLKDIVLQEKEPIVLVVSAMGKTTNALERVVNALWLRENEQAEREWCLIQEYHEQIASELGISIDFSPPEATFSWDGYDELYDQLVSYGEMFSSTLISRYLQRFGLDNRWLDVSQLLITDNHFRQAEVDFYESEQRVKNAVSDSEREVKLWVTQGFIGGTEDGKRTTLGREGSDYSASIMANLLNAQSVTIWKDVPGIMTADPHRDKSARLIEELSYQEAETLALSGAQIIHRRTVEPLIEKQIPLYVRPFANPKARGSVIH